MIVLLSNRKLASNNKLSNELENDKSTLHLAKVTNYNRTEVPYFNFEDEFSDEITVEFNPELKIYQGDIDANLSSLASEVDQEDKHKPWVFFIHGNNQSIEKNLEKCAILEHTHDVNVFAFSWPSKPPIPLDKKEMMKIIFSIALKPSDYSNYIKLVKEYCDWKHEMYTQARHNATQSIDQLGLAFNKAFSTFFPQLPEPVEKSLLIHSLGNYLGQCFFEQKGTQFDKPWFKHVMLHQGDSVYETHASWLNEQSIKFVKEKIFITHNRKDKILLASELEKFVYKSQLSDEKRRLGRGNGDVISSDARAIYINFTKANMVGTDHNFFNLSPMDNQGVNMIMKNILRSESFNVDLLADYSSPDNKYYYYSAPLDGIDEIEDDDEF